MVTRAEQAENKALCRKVWQKAHHAAIRDVSREHEDEVAVERCALIAGGMSTKDASTRARRNVALGKYRTQVRMVRTVYFDHYSKEYGYAPLPGVQPVNRRDGRGFVSPYEENDVPV